MEDKNYTVKEALKLLKAGYYLLLQGSDDSSSFFFDGKHIIVKGENEGLVLNTFRFLDLFKDSVFQIDYSQNDEDAVDPKKDDEYYSWRQ